ncbi:hydrolethalus syndrome protein 1 homolog [Strongylocentrotus purpuratus]|uniref:Centriolar and ciliogenesis-associated protein HYLS1 C-terminal domain-containing protein n=1 Tax=Strongylocentrotus purpuratus TaxID=7668 RepID=A0A7M7LP08_STRPU|nr:hydrolethalus syndrome protein 1 homolog [Strongylocentrotus purpuratus]
MADLNFSEEDIKRQLELLGYRDVPRHRLAQFARDLERLIDEDRLPMQSDDSLYSNMSDHQSSSRIRSPDTSTDVSHDRSAVRSPFNDVPRRSNNRQVQFTESPVLKQSRQDQENQPVPTTSSGNQRSGQVRSPGVIDSKVYDPYERREARSTGAAAKKVPMKRKVVRKRAGQSQVFDESVTESESDMSYLNERLQDLPLNDDETESETSSSGFDSYRRHVGRPHSSQGLYSHRPAGNEESVYKPNQPRSFIRPSSAKPTWKHNKKTDPVTRHQMYRDQWNSQKAPGEKNHKGLRWSVRELMMYKDEVVQPKSTPRVYVPNSYVVPSDKKRQALRWAVRTQLAHREMPSTSFDF